VFKLVSICQISFLLWMFFSQLLTYLKILPPLFELIIQIYIRESLIFSFIAHLFCSIFLSTVLHECRVCLKILTTLNVLKIWEFFSGTRQPRLFKRSQLYARWWRSNTAKQLIYSWSFYNTGKKKQKLPCKVNNQISFGPLLSDFPSRF